MLLLLRLLLLLLLLLLPPPLSLHLRRLLFLSFLYSA
jgi:hypothetical protein